MIKLFIASSGHLRLGLSCAASLALACVACKDAAGADSADAAISSARDAAVGGEDLRAEGCRPDQPASAYKARASGAEAVDSPAARAPLPCFGLTGYGSAESTLGIAKDGSLFFAPAFAPEGNGVLRSRDAGRSWQLLVPSWTDGTGHKKAQPYLFLDPSTDRVFFASSAAGLSIGGGGFDLSISSDGGDSWDHQLVATDTGDWMKIMAGPAVSSATSDYPNLVYLSAPSPISTPPSFLGLMGGPEKQAIYRSSDGGKHFDEVGSINLKPANVPSCDPNEWIIFGAGATAADGTLYLGARLCRQLAVAVSGDEGGTWAVHTVPNTALRPIDTRTITTITSNENVLVTEPLATDHDGNLYAVWVDADDMLRLSTSQDKAQTWSTPVAIRAPGLTAVRYGAVAVRTKGTIAIAYYGTRDGVRYDGYVAESSNALDAEPVFWSSTVNDPADPLFSQGFDSGYLSLLSGGDLVEIVQVKYAPNGDIWAAFVKDMCPGAGTSPVDCVDWDPSMHGASGFQGAVGRLVHTR